MIITIDGKELELNLDDKELLLKEVQQRLLDKGRILHSIKVDGEEVEEDVFLSCQGVETVDFLSTSIRQCVLESLESAESYFPALLNGMERIVEFLEGEETDKALKSLQQGIEGIGWLLHTMRNSQFLLGAEDKDLADGNLKETWAHLEGALKKASLALEKAQMLELAYIIRNEVIPLLDGLSPYIEGLLSLARSAIQ
ncbi:MULTISPECIES: hypothetical protein [Aminobacterium]|uniref:hypothetical protein n=1 Tax=Aminobacterium TaxID=81466 RepID=UPI00257B0217|nr:MULTISPECIES: hypothetical protein [unclassified Aminobacterium]